VNEHIWESLSSLLSNDANADQFGLLTNEIRQLSTYWSDLLKLTELSRRKYHNFLFPKAMEVNEDFLESL